MFRSGLALLLLAGAGMFTYYFVTDRGDKTDGQRASDALAKVGDVAMDQGMASAVKARLTVSFGLEGARFMHTWFDGGKVLVYGLAPAGVTADQIAAEARQIPGVREVEVQILPRPDYVTSVMPPSTPAQPPAQPEQPATGANHR